MNVGIIGLGKMGLLHAGILNTLQDVNLSAITEKEKLITKYVKTFFPKMDVFGDYQQMIKNSDLDLIYITTPPNSHLPIISDCLDNNIKFFVEKPLTSNFTDAKKIISHLSTNSPKNFVGYNLRFNTTFVKAKQLIDSNTIGKINNVKSSMYVSSIFSKQTGWRYRKKSSGGGVLLELGCHLVDLLLWYLGNIDFVNGNVKKVYSDVEDFAHMELEFANGAIGVLDTSWSVKGYRIPELNIEFTGDNGTIRVNQDFIDIKLNSLVTDVEELDTRIYKQSLSDNVSFDVGGTDYTHEDQHVIECITKNLNPLIDIREASKTQSVIHHMYLSAKSSSRNGVNYV